MTFGNKKVIIVAGMNKVTTALDSALKLVREVAATMEGKKSEYGNSMRGDRYMQ